MNEYKAQKLHVTAILKYNINDTMRKIGEINQFN